MRNLHVSHGGKIDLTNLQKMAWTQRGQTQQQAVSAQNTFMGKTEQTCIGRQWRKEKHDRNNKVHIDAVQP